MDPCNGENDPSLIRRLQGHRGEVTGLSFHPDCTQLVSSSTDSTLILWNLKKHAHAIKFENHSDQVTDVNFLPNGKLFASSSKDQTVRLWIPSIKTKSKIIKAHTSAVRSVHASADSTVLLTASNDKNIKMWMSEYNNKFVSSFKGHTHWVNCARFSSDGKHVVSCSEDRSAKLWDRHTNCLIHSFEEKVIPLYIEFHQNNKCIGVTFSNGHIKIYDIRNYKLLQFYSNHTQGVNKLAFHPSGNFFISGDNEGLVKVFDIMEGRIIYTLEGHDGPVTAVTFSPSGNQFATAGADRKIFVWDTNFYKEILARPVEKSVVNSRSSEILAGKSRTVNARLSLSHIEQPEVNVSSAQQSPSEEKSTCFDSTETGDETFESTNGDQNKNADMHKGQSRLNSIASTDVSFHSFNATNNNSSAGGDASAENFSNVLEKVKQRVNALKLEVGHLQEQLGEIMETLESVKIV